MLLSAININRCGRWQKIRLIFNAIGCSNFGTISAAGTRPNCSNILVLKCCGCIYPIPSSHLQLRHFNQTAAISSTTKSLTRITATENEQQPKPSKSIEPNEIQNQQQTKNNPETTEEEQQLQQNETLIGQLPVRNPANHPAVLSKKNKIAAQSRPNDLTPKKSISIGDGGTLYIQCQQWGSGQKFLDVYTRSLGFFQNLPQILVPQGAYKFVAAMDEVIRQLSVDEPQDKEGDEKPLVLAIQIVAGGRHYDFKLSAWHQTTGDKCHFDIRSVPTSEKHKERELRFPLWALPWLREQMVRMLEEHDGSQRIDEMPTIPEWATPDAPPKIGQQEQQSAPAT